MDTVKTPFPVVKEAPRRDPILLFRKNSLVLVLLMPWFSPLPVLSLAIREVGACPPWGLYGPRYYFMAFLIYSGQACGVEAVQNLRVDLLLSSFLYQKSCLKDFFFQDRSINFHLFLYSTPLSPNLMAVTVKPYETKA